MAMKILDRTHEGKIERKILLGMIVSTDLLRHVVQHWDGKMFKNGESNRIGEWCVDHYKKHNKAPYTDIDTIFTVWANESGNDDDIEKVELLLSQLSKDGEQKYPNESDLNIPHLKDIAQSYFKKVRLKNLSSSIEGYLDNNRVEDAEQMVTKYSKLEMNPNYGVHVLTDMEVVQSTFSETAGERLIRYDGSRNKGLDLFFRNEMEREGFVAFAGPQKSGKTYSLIDTAYRAIKNRKKVGFFEIGDLSQRQILQRIYARITKYPVRSPDGTWPCSLILPQGIEHGVGDQIARITKSISKSYGKPQTWMEVWEASKRFMKNDVRSDDSYFQLSTHPNLSISAAGIRNVIQSWILGGWVPDVIVIDYADNLAPSVKQDSDPRHDVNTNWKILRGIAIEFKVLVVTATQVKAAGFNKPVLERSDFSEDNRKLSHVTAMVGINVKPEEKILGITRYNWIVKREGEFDPRRCVHCAGHLALSSPAMCSVYPTYVPKPVDKPKKS